MRPFHGEIKKDPRQPGRMAGRADKELSTAFLRCGTASGVNSFRLLPEAGLPVPEAWFSPSTKRPASALSGAPRDYWPQTRRCSLRQSRRRGEVSNYEETTHALDHFSRSGIEQVLGAGARGRGVREVLRNRCLPLFQGVLLFLKQGRDHRPDGATQDATDSCGIRGRALGIGGDGSSPRMGRFSLST